MAILFISLSQGLAWHLKYNGCLIKVGLIFLNDGKAEDRPAAHTDAASVGVDGER